MRDPGELADLEPALAALLDVIPLRRDERGILHSTADCTRFNEAPYPVTLEQLVATVTGHEYADVCFYCSTGPTYVLLDALQLLATPPQTAYERAIADLANPAGGRHTLQEDWLTRDPDDPRACCRYQNHYLDEPHPLGIRLWAAAHARTHAWVAARTRDHGPATTLLVATPYARTHLRAPTTTRDDLTWRTPFAADRGLQLFALPGRVARRYADQLHTTTGRADAASWKVLTSLWRAQPSWRTDPPAPLELDQLLRTAWHATH